MKKLFLMLILGIFMFSLVSAVNECGNENSFLGTFKHNTTITLKQTCDSCTYVNLSSVNYPNSTKLIYNTNMTKSGIEFTRSSNDTKVFGCFSYSVYGDVNGVLTSETIDYMVTPSGQSGSSNIVFFMFIIIFLYVMNLTGIFLKNEWLTILTGMFLLALGIYVINNGIIIYKDWITNYFALVTISWGLFTTLIASLSIIDGG